ncbi:Protein of unknown function [Bacillus mobilis]|nr:Protein of unknown function [Bacillus mobilis]
MVVWFSEISIDDV